MTNTLVLSVKPFIVGDNKHTGINISTLLEQSMQDFGIKKNKIFMIVADNASNIVAGIEGLNITHLSCFLHTMALIVKNSVFEQNSIARLITKCKAIVTKIKKSPAAGQELKLLQEEEDLPQNKLLQVLI